MARAAFHRPARVWASEVPATAVSLPGPPEAKDKSGAGSMLNLLFPLLSSVGMAAYMISFGRPVMIVIGLVFVGVAIVSTIGMRSQLRSSDRRSGRRQRMRYTALLNEARAAARSSATLQRRATAMTHPCPDDVWGIVADRRRVWERRSSDPDFLHVRVGAGRAPLVTPIELANRIDPLNEYDASSMRGMHRLLSQHGWVDDQPAIVDLASSGVVSVVGSVDASASLVRSMLLQITALHAPDDVTVLVNAPDPDAWEWAKWLPHAERPDRDASGAPATLIAADLSEMGEFLDTELASRLAAVRTRRTNPDHAASPRRLVIVIDRFAPMSGMGRSTLLRQLLDAAGPALGITVVVVCETEDDEPSRVDVRLRLNDAHGTELTISPVPTMRFSATKKFRADGVDSCHAQLVARKLSPLRLIDPEDEALVEAVSLSDLLLGLDPRDVDFTDAWREGTDPDVLRVPIGTDGKGEAVELDIKESARGGAGPHGLIVGATGSGKSELLRTIVTAMAMTHSPDVLNFSLVDFKGGAAFAPLATLPHVSGLITNLADDASLVDRFGQALLGEQQRRQRMLRDAGDLDSVHDYHRRRAAGGVDLDGRALQPLPYLMVIVDEFGELLSGRPDLTDLFVQLGRVGRSLGIHLLMATQRLEEGRLRGLESHLSYRVCLRTFSAAESRVVIGSADAYHLPSIPGSAYLKVDESTYTRLRVAHVSAPYRDHEPAAESLESRSRVELFGVTPTLTDGAGSPDDTADGAREQASVAAAAVSDPVAVTDDDSVGTELAIVVDRIAMLGRPTHQMWLPPLPEEITLGAVLGHVEHSRTRGLHAPMAQDAGSLAITVGIVDLPQQQLQRSMVVDLAGGNGHFAAVGAPRSGRSTLLRTLVTSAMLTHTPDELRFVCLDFGGGTLQTLAEAPHVGSVAGRTDLDLARRTVAQVQAEIAQREREMSRLGVESISSLRTQRSMGALPADLSAADLVLVIDNWGAVRTELPELEALVTDIAARGLGVGVHLVLTAARWFDIRPALRDSIGSRFELHLNDPADSEINRRLAARTPAVPGRGLIAPGLAVQVLRPSVAMPGESTAADALVAYDAPVSSPGLVDTESDWADFGFTVADDTLAPRPDALTEEQPEISESQLAERAAAGWRGSAAPTIQLLPDLVAADGLATADVASRSSVAIGLSDHDLSTVELDLESEDAHLMVFGDASAGKTEFLRMWLDGLVRARSSDEVRVAVVDYRRSLMESVPESHAISYAGHATAAAGNTTALARKLAERMPPPDITLRQLHERTWWTGPEVYLVVDDYDLVGGHDSPLAELVPLLPHARDIGLHLVIARRVSGATRMGMSDRALTSLRELGAANLIFSGDPREGVIAADQRAIEGRPAGRGTLVRRGRPALVVQTGLLSPPGSLRPDRQQAFA